MPTHPIVTTQLQPGRPAAAYLVVIISSLLAGCAGYQSLETSATSPAPTATGQHPAPTATSTPPHSTVGRQLQHVFERYHGTPYRYGGTTPAGFDCSGFIVTAYREGLNTPLPRTTGMMLNQGRFVRRDQLQEGDIVFFRIGGKEQHAGIYLGNNRFIHSATSIGVTESSLANAYWQQRYSQARRFL